MGWLVALFLLAAAGGIWWWHDRTVARRWRQLHEILEDLTAGREPRSLVFGAGGRFAGLSAQLERLVDEQDRLRRWRSREEANLQTILASMEEGVLVVDHEHVIRLVNPSLLRILELKNDPLGQSVLRALRQVDFEKIVTATLEADRPQKIELAVHHSDPPRQLAITATRIRVVSGEAAVVMIFHDVTRLKQLEEVRREFVANVSHELRTPLSIFQGYLENLLDHPDLPTPERVQVLEILQRHSSRLNLLVEDLLILARLESRSDKLKLEPLSPAEFLRGIAADWKLRSEQHEITLTVEVAPAAPVFSADRFRLEQVLNNLIDNALKYGTRGGAVSIRAAGLGQEIELRVEDAGPGIAPADLPHIFERFYRVDKARSRERGGTGLGLSIVKHITQLHGGTVEAENRPEGGTSIIVRLPLRPEGSVPEPGGEPQQAIDARQHDPEAQLAK